jgi:hypothetical protein
VGGELGAAKCQYRLIPDLADGIDQQRDGFIGGDYFGECPPHVGLGQQIDPPRCHVLYGSRGVKRPVKGENPVPPRCEMGRERTAERAAGPGYDNPLVASRSHGSGGFQKAIDVSDRLQLLDIIFRKFASEDFFQPQYKPDALQRIPSFDLRQQNVVRRHQRILSQNLCYQVARVHQFLWSNN